MVTELPHSNDYFSSPRSQAQRLLEQGKYEAALQQFAQAPQAMQNSVDLVNQAVCLIHLDRPQEALWLCDRALTLAPNHAQAWLFRGVALHRLGKYQEAYACYDRALGDQRSSRRPAFMTRMRHQAKTLKSLLKHIKSTNPLRLWVN